MPNDNSSEHIENGEQENARSVEPSPPPTSIPILISSPNNPNTHNTTDVSQNSVTQQVEKIEDRIKSAERWMIWLTAAVAFFALCSVVVGIFQWRAMNGQLQEMKSDGSNTRVLVEAAKKNSELALIQAEASAAADCQIIANVTDDLPNVYLVISCQKGNVYSSIKNGEFIAETHGIGKSHPVWRSQKFPIAPQTIAPSGVSREIIFSFAKYSREDFYALKQVLTVEGFFDYDDGFGRIIHRPFCNDFLVFRDQVGGIYRGVTTVSCDRLSAQLRQYATADEQQKQQHPPLNPN